MKDDLRNVMDFAQVMLNYHAEDSLWHFSDVRNYAKLLCLKYNRLYPNKAIPENEMEYICEGARLHDIGKICVPEELLSKKGALDEEEYRQIQRHTVVGAQIVGRMAEIYHLGAEQNILKNICKYHHERYDGSGYPEGLKGDAIPLEAQIVAIAEVYASMTADNYKEAVSHRAAMEAILNGECGAFNPELIECMRKIDDDLKLLMMTRDDDNRRALLENVTSKDRKRYWQIKRTMDILISGVALLLLSPLLAIIALAIYIDDPKGSPIFCQTRLGRHKKPFKMYKFRTMVVDAEARKKELQALNEKDGPAFKIKDDPRITRVGRFLRKTSLDELPQLVNVFKGDMSLVGPRPPLPEEVEQYNLYHEMRLSVTPGLTCEWQIQPERDAIGFEQWVDMDIGYIGTRSIRNDLRTILHTVACMLRKSGS